MQEKAFSIDIPDIAEMLEDRKSESQRIAVIIGSRAGALFRSGEFYDDLNAYSARNLADMDERPRFSESYSVLENIYKRRSMSISEIKSFIEGQVYRHLDVAPHLAELVKDDFFKIVITNNIDDHLYESFKSVGMQEKIDFVDIPLGRLSCTGTIERVLSQRKINVRRLIRMAGDIDTFVGNLNRPQEQKATGDCVRSLLEQLRIREILIIGVDLAWDQAILSALPSHLETIWFINEDEHVKGQFIAKCGNVKNFHYLTGPKGSYEHFFKLLYWNINQGITQSHQLIEEVNNNLHNLRIELNNAKKRNEEKDAMLMEKMESMRSKMESIMHLLEEIRENKIPGGD